MYILLKKKFYTKLFFNILHYICFLCIKSFFSNIKFTCVSIIINCISFFKDLNFTKNLISQISLSYLNNQKSVFRFNSLNLILKILINLKYSEIQDQLEKTMLFTFFHFSFDFDFLCRFFSGLICKFVTSIVSKRSQNVIKSKMHVLIFCDNILINIRTNLFSDWICVICKGKKNYGLIKLVSFPKLWFFLKKKLNIYYDWIYFFLKIKTFFYLLEKNKEFINFSLIFRIFFLLLLKLVEKKILLVKNISLEIFIFLTKNIFQGFILCFNLMVSVEYIEYILFVNKFDQFFKSILKKQIRVFILYVYTISFCPSLLKNYGIQNLIFRNQNENLKNLSLNMIKFLKKSDILFISIVFSSIFFFNNIYISITSSINKRIIKNKNNIKLKNSEYMFFKYFNKIKFILIKLLD